MGGSVGRGITKLGSGITKASTFGLSDLVKYKGHSVSDIVGNPYDQIRSIDNPSQQTAASNGFGFDPNQSANDQAAINALGQKQYGDSLAAIDTNATAQNDAASKFFKASLPNIAENAQAAHLYDSTGYGQEVARQQAAIANSVAANTANQKLGANQALQGYQTGALQRGMSLEDFVNQANVAKAIGAQYAPQAPSSKATGISGAGSGAAAGSSFGPYGALIGAGVGAIAGSNANQKGSK